ncbi:MAG: GNAT family N-acetyltransferase [Actinophytocola sp.]|nr:GNAT family N-acetyltransferase [Actinophytocola sp.]
MGSPTKPRTRGGSTGENDAGRVVPSGYALPVQVEITPYDDPDAAKLIAEVQQEYVTRYGDHDGTPVEPSEFAPPRGLFFVGYLDGTPVACGGWRAHDGPAPEFQPGDAEMKRLYVAERARGNGHARAMIEALERSAREAGRLRMILETGRKQPEAISLYRSIGYTPIPKFGVYHDDPLSICFGKALTE